VPPPGTPPPLWALARGLPGTIIPRSRMEMYGLAGPLFRPAHDESRTAISIRRPRGSRGGAPRLLVLGPPPPLWSAHPPLAPFSQRFARKVVSLRPAPHENPQPPARKAGHRHLHGSANPLAASTLRGRSSSFIISRGLPPMDMMRASPVGRGAVLSLPHTLKYTDLTTTALLRSFGPSSVMAAPILLQPYNICSSFVPGPPSTFSPYDVQVLFSETDQTRFGLTAPFFRPCCRAS